MSLIMEVSNISLGLILLAAVSLCSADRGEEMPVVKMKRYICPQFKHKHHPISGRHRWYHYLSCGNSLPRDQVLSNLSRRIEFAFDGIPLDVGYLLTYRHNSLFNGFENVEFTNALRNYFSKDLPCPQWSDFRTIPCSADDINVSCNDYRNMLYKDGLINDYDKFFYDMDNSVPMFDVRGNFIAGISCATFDFKPTLESLWKLEWVSQVEIDRHLEDYEYERKCLSEGGTNPDCMRGAPNYKKFWELKF